MPPPKRSNSSEDMPDLWPRSMEVGVGTLEEEEEEEEEEDGNDIIDI